MAEAPIKVKPDTIVMVHGLWMTPRSWEHWKERYEARGYTVHAPAWPGFEVEVEALNADPSPMNDLEAETVIDSYETFINDLDSDPIIMGHSLGGAMTQVLLNRGLGSVGIGLSAATVKGVRDLPFSTLRAAAPALNPFKRGKPVPMTEKEFHYAFANTMSEEESKPIWERYCVPAATGVLADIALANIHRNPPTEVDFAKQGRIPLLFIGLSEDHVVPPKATMHNERKYDDSVSITEYKEFEGRPHFPGAPGWEEVADFAIDWAERHAGLTVAEHATADNPGLGKEHQVVRVSESRQHVVISWKPPFASCLAGAPSCDYFSRAIVDCREHPSRILRTWVLTSCRWIGDHGNVCTPATRCAIGIAHRRKAFRGDA